MFGFQVWACRDSGYEWFEQLLQNVSLCSFLIKDFDIDLIIFGAISNFLVLLLSLDSPNVFSLCPIAPQVGGGCLL